MRVPKISVRTMCTLKSATAPEKPLSFPYANFFKHKDSLTGRTGYCHDLRTGRQRYSVVRYLAATAIVCTFPPLIIWTKLMGHS